MESEYPAFVDFLVLLIPLSLGLMPAFIARSKGRSFWLWWLYGFGFFLIAFIHSLFLRRYSENLLPVPEADAVKFQKPEVAHIGFYLASLRHPDWRVREAAVEALGALGPRASGARVDLEATKRDADRRVRARAGWALERVGKAAPSH
jgi:hypothetical protein